MFSNGSTAIEALSTAGGEELNQCHNPTPASERTPAARSEAASVLAGRSRHADRGWRCRYRRLPELDLRRIAALRQVDADGVVHALGVVILAELLADAAGLDAHDGIYGRIEILGPVEDLPRDDVALEAVSSAGERLADDKVEESAPPWRMQEGPALEDALQLLANGQLVGFALEIERNCGHARLQSKTRSRRPNRAAARL